jgi:tape measure domain-containing protein
MAVGNVGTLRLEIRVDDQGSVKVKRFGEEAEAAGHKARRGLGSLSGVLSGIAGGLTDLRTLAASAFAAWGVERLASGLIETASSVEQMTASLDTLTKGRGAETFEAMTAWALEMPVNTQKAIDSFRLMKAMGLDPTLDTMTTLVDTMGALGGNEETLEGIARALGQIQTRGKVSAEELNQLAERGVPAFQILQEKLGLTAAELGNIGAAGVDAETAIRALMEGMADRFGGQAERMQGTWAGIMETLKSTWTEFQRLVADSGAFAALKASLKEVADMVSAAASDGRMAQWAAETGAKITDVIAAVVKATGYIPLAWASVKKAVSLAMGAVTAFGQAVVQVGAKAITAFGRVADPFGIFGVADRLGSAGKSLDDVAGFLADFGAAQLEGAQDAEDASVEWAEIGVRIEGFADKLRSNAGEAAARIAGAAAPALAAIGDLEGEIRRQVEETASVSVSATRKAAEEDLKALNDRLKGWQSYYSQVVAAGERAKESLKKHQEELLAIERQRTDARAGTEALVSGLTTADLAPVEQYNQRRSALDRQYTEAMRRDGQERVDALKAYQQAVADVARQFQGGITEQSAFGMGERAVLSSRAVIDAAVGDIERAGAAADRALQEMADAKARQMEADRKWADQMEQAAADAAGEIDALSQHIGEVMAALEAMDATVTVYGEDQATAVISAIQAEIDALHDKTVTLTTVHVEEYPGSSGEPSLLDSSMKPYATGTAYVPKDGLYRLHKGESVQNVREARAAGTGGGSVSVGELHVHVPAAAQANTPADWREITRQYIAPELGRIGRG